MNPSLSTSRPDVKGNLLVIGYGNLLRQDDGVGVRVAEQLGAMTLPGVSAITCAQLSPEYAENVSDAGRVVFVDAIAEGTKQVRLRAVEPAESSQVTTHVIAPSTILALARDVFGRAPPAWWLTIPVVRFGVGDEMSPEAQRGAETAIREVLRLRETRQDQASSPAARAG